MKDEVKIFESPQFGAIRTTGTSEEPLFCLADICKVLELQVQNTKKRLNQKGVYQINTLTEGGNQSMLYVNEQNLYKVIMRSDKPQAEPFQDWVCGEVLPSIRKNGGYITAAPEETPEMIMARALKVADETMKRQQAQLAEANETIKDQNQRIQIAQGTIEEQEKQIKKDAPLADFARDVLQSSTTYTLTEISKDLDFRSVYAFTEWANRHGILYRQSDRWLPNAKYSGKGLFATRTCKYVKSDNTIGTSLSTVVTEKGRASFHDFKKRLEEQERKMIIRQHQQQTVNA